jgi:hypothetical protein
MLQKFRLTLSLRQVGEASSGWRPWSQGGQSSNTSASDLRSVVADEETIVGGGWALVLALAVSDKRFHEEKVKGA